MARGMLSKVFKKKETRKADFRSISDKTVRTKGKTLVKPAAKPRFLANFANFCFSLFFRETQRIGREKHEKTEIVKKTDKSNFFLLSC